MLAALQRLVRGRTVVLVAHRPALLGVADRVLELGRLPVAGVTSAHARSECRASATADPRGADREPRWRWRTRPARTARARQPARRRSDRCRDRSDRHVGVAYLPGVAAPAGVGAGARHRRRAVLRPVTRPVSIRAAARRSRRGISVAGGSPHELLRTIRGAGAGRVTGVPPRGPAGAGRPRHRLPPGPPPEGDPAVCDSTAGRRRHRRAGLVDPARGRSDPARRAGARRHRAHVAHRQARPALRSPAGDRSAQS